MTIGVESAPWSYYEFGTVDSYKEILAFIFGDLPESYDVFREADIFEGELPGCSFPIVTVNTKGISLVHERLDADTVRAVEIRVKGVKTRIFTEAVVRAGSFEEKHTHIRKALDQATAFDLFLFFACGIDVNERVPYA